MSIAVELRPPRHRVEQRAIVWWTARALSLVLPITCGLTVAYVVWDAARTWVGPVLLASAAIGAVYVVAMPVCRYHVHGWEATGEAVYARSGWVVREWRVAPISRIQTVDTVRGPMQQLLGLATLTVTTASSRGAINIGGLDQHVATEAARQLTEITQLTPGDQT